MDLLKILQARVANLPDGEHTSGLSAVIEHVEVATKHLRRGQKATDDAAFTDAIYRTNQAFEGSLKEAYRVLAGKDPASETPNRIESYLQQQDLLKPRVLAQFGGYRKEWRNPSTHDYRLKFDEDEALLAIVTVSAFAIVLIDQIAERLSFDQTRAATRRNPSRKQPARSLIDEVSTLITQFVSEFSDTRFGKTEAREGELIAALSGFLSSAAPHMDVITESTVGPRGPEKADLIVISKKNRLLIEVKLRRFAGRLDLHQALYQVSRYMALSPMDQAILFIFLRPNDGTVTQADYDAQIAPGRIRVLTTKPKPSEE